jgi:transcriptional regulator with XRE-family HTH domain
MKTTQNTTQIDTQQIGQLVKTRREALKLSQPHLARMAGVSVVTVRNVESGNTAPAPYTARRLGAALDLPDLIKLGLGALSNERYGQVLDAVRAHVKANYSPPTLRQLGQRVGITSTSLLRFYLLGLIEQGYLVRLNNGKWASHWYCPVEMVAAIKAINWQ